MVFIVGKRRLDDGMPAFGVFLLAAITADDEVIGGARHRHIKQPSIFVFGGRLQPFFVRANEMVGKAATGQPDREGVFTRFDEAQFRNMAVIEGLRTAIDDKNDRRLKALGGVHGHDTYFATVLVLLAFHFR